MRANGWAAGRGRGVACGTALPHTAARRRRDAPQGGVSERTAPAAPLSRRRRRGSARAGPATGPAAGDGATWPHGSRAAFAHVAVDTICRAHGRVYARATLRRVDGDAQRVAARGAGQDLRCMVSNSLEHKYRFGGHVGGAGAIARVGLVALVDCVLVAPPERGPGRFGPFPKWGEPRKFARQVAARSLARTSADVRDARACVYAAVRLGAGQLRVGTRKRSPNGHDRARRRLHARSCRLRNSLARTHICRCASFQDAARGAELAASPR